MCFTSSGDLLALVEDPESAVTHLTFHQRQSRQEKILTTFPLSSGAQKIARSHDSSVIALGGGRDVELLRVIDDDSSCDVKTVRVIHGSGPGVTTPVMGFDGASVYIANLVPGFVIKRSVSENREVHRWRAPSDICHALAVSRCERFIAVSGHGASGGFFVIDTESSKHILTDLYHSEASPDTVAFTKSGVHLTRRKGRAAGLINLFTGERLCGPKLPGGRAEITCAAPDYDLIAYALPSINSIFTVALHQQKTF